MTRLTLYIIANNPDIVIDHGGPDPAGKYCGWITLGEEDNYRPILNGNPIFATAEAAEEDMRRIVREAKAFLKKDLANPENPLRALIESPEGKIVTEVVTAAHA